MRIETAINEVREHQKPELRSPEVEKKRVQAKTDSVDLSPAGKALSLSQTSDVRQDKVEQARQRVRDGYYDKPEVLKAIADAIIRAGAVDPVAKEIQSIRTVTKGLADVPNLREEKVTEAQERVKRGFYDLPVIRNQIAKNVTSALVG